MDDHSKAIEAAAVSIARWYGADVTSGDREVARAVVEAYLRARAEGESPAVLAEVDQIAHAYEEAKRVVRRAQWSVDDKPPEAVLRSEVAARADLVCLTLANWLPHGRVKAIRHKIDTAPEPSDPGSSPLEEQRPHANTQREGDDRPGQDGEDEGAG